MTSIELGPRQVIEVNLPLDDVRKLLQEALAGGTLLEFESEDGEIVVINPQQVKVLQNMATS